MNRLLDPGVILAPLSIFFRKHCCITPLWWIFLDSPSIAGKQSKIHPFLAVLAGDWGLEISR
jgi:hypothetical protein